MSSLDRVHRSSELEALQARFAVRVASRLTQQADRLPPDVAERLRFARERAIGQALRTERPPEVASLPLALGGPALALRDGPSDPWWLKLASLLPLLVLLAGLIVIQQWHTRAQISAAAEIDALLLADDLPPSAYSDPGFVEFLRSAPRD